MLKRRWPVLLGPPILALAMGLLVLGAQTAARAMGLVYGSALALDARSTHLAVQSCTDLACVTRVFDLTHAGSEPRILRAPEQGRLLGFAGSELVTWQACVGYPCPILAWNVGTDRARRLTENATAAALTGNGRRVVASVGDASGAAMVEIDIATGRLVRLRGLAAGARPLANSPTAVLGLEVAADQVAIAVPGSDPFPLEPDTAAEEVLP
ncbi:MAG TPA: hypothetical protein VKR30_01640 [Candidatus Limnocylindrales bacterium]|nr:hypothetical protein [Candidatus Limnocylindrales bacterium]